MMSELHEVNLPTMIGASHIEDPSKPKSRVTGAPSQKYPILRDLLASPATITIEIDTETERITGVLQSMDSEREPRLTLAPPSGARRSIKLTKIIAFRVLKVEVKELPAVV